jgi:hypothetical protein
VYCTVRRRLRARVAREGAMRIAVEIAIFVYRVLLCADEGKQCGDVCGVWRCDQELLAVNVDDQTSAAVQSARFKSTRGFWSAGESTREHAGALSFAMLRCKAEVH